MATRVRIISVKNTDFDHLVKDIVGREAWGVPHEYFGITDQERANTIRKRIYNSRTHMKPRVSIAAYYHPCTGCPNGGPECRYHVNYTVWPFEHGKAYKEAQAGAARKAVGQ